MFTYCLVTKGRRDYLLNILDSLDTALLSPDVQVIVVDNGCPDDISEVLTKWCNLKGGKKHYLRFDTNDPSAPRVWSALKDFDIDWLTFPGDDDVVHPEFLEHARTLIRKQKGLTAIASSMRIINSDGIPTGLTRMPLEFLGDRVTYLASSLHEPPFLFPGLFVNFSKVPFPLPNSRYVFDWWLALNLISLGPVLSTSEVSIDYRVHADQESFLAPNRRKYFEAQVIFTRFIQGKHFQEFLLQLSDSEKFKLWKSLADRGPIYGDVEHGSALMFVLTVMIADSMTDSTSSANLLGMFAAANGAFLRSGESKALLSSKYFDSAFLGSNFRLSTIDGTCSELVHFADTMNVVDDEAMQFTFGCQHSATSGEFKADCKLFQTSPESAIDLLVVQITEKLEIDGLFDFKITPAERKILELLRSLKLFLPSNLATKVKRGLVR